MKRFAVLVVVLAVAACDRKPAPATGPGTGGTPTSPADARAALAAGEALWRQGRAPEAIVKYEEALRADPALFPAWLRWQEALRELKKPEVVLGEIRLRLSKQPADPRWLTLAALAEPELMEENLRRAIKEAPEFPWAHYVFAAFHLERKRFDEALREVDRALQLDPENGLFFLMKGGVLAAAGRQDEAIAALTRAKNLLPGDERPCVGLAQALIDSDRFDDAIAELETAIRLAPGAKSPGRVLRDLRLRQGQLALKEYDEMKRSNVLLEAVRCAERAVAYLAPVVEEFPDDDDARRLHAWALTASGAAWLARANASAQEGRFEEAREHALKSEACFNRVKIPPPDDVKDFLAQGLLRLGAALTGIAESTKEKGDPKAADDFRRAIRLFETCLLVDPDSRTAKTMADEVRKLLEEK